MLNAGSSQAGRGLIGTSSRRCFSSRLTPTLRAYRLLGNASDLLAEQTGTIVPVTELGSDHARKPHMKGRSLTRLAFNRYLPAVRLRNHFTDEQTESCAFFS